MSELPRIYKTEAIVLHQREIGEADRLLTVYTPSLGKLTVLAKGVRRSKSKIGGHVETLSQSTLLLSQGHTLDIVSQAQLVESFVALRDDLWRLSCGLYVAEMVDRFTPDRHPNSDVYLLLEETLRRICEARKGDLVLRFFEMRFLDLMGYRPQLHQCVVCEEPLKAGPFAFSSASGGLVCADCRDTMPSGQLKAVSVNAVKALRFLQDNDFETALRLKLDSELSTELEYLLRSFLAYVLENEIKSNAWLDRVRRTPRV